MISIYEKKYRELNKYINKLKNIYINRYIGIVVGPNKYEFDVKSFCILAHAAFEEYFEFISTKLFENCISNFINNNKFSQITIGLIAANCNNDLKMNIDSDDTNPEKDVIDYLKTLVGDIRPRMTSLVKRNNGISPRYIRKLLLPNTINISNRTTLINSLKELSKHRGDYAHNMMITRPLGPEDARDYVNDVILICEYSKNQAKKLVRKNYTFL
jgi:hypothetical protein